ncbi:Na-translocating system protein MpsC family protein [Planococcus alpniumensis]|uniref:Na-translocating system protein MpsC family protein n=1 Tax=Planococcus alpniumensis TaxID=2708345 RepID=UPI001B8C308F|nr:Na-translocating system protein MpsC family protein [Planococcus sp. MSAK28401]
MAKGKTYESEISGYISTTLRKHFGKGPTSVYVTIKHPFITIHFRGFLAPMEKLQIKQEESKRVLATRDIVMLDLKPEILQGLREVAEIELKELYADWNLTKETGMIIGVMNEETTEDTENWPDNVNPEVVRKKIDEASRHAEKTPDRTDIYWLNERTILVRRSGILVRIEKELIKNGFIEALKLSKRPLEHELLEEVGLEQALNRTTSEIFLDWDFEKDVSYIVLLLEPKER